MQKKHKSNKETSGAEREPERVILQAMARLWQKVRTWKEVRWKIIGRDALDAALICGAVNILIQIERSPTTRLYPMLGLQQERMSHLESMFEGALVGCALAFFCHLGMDWVREREAVHASDGGRNQG